MGCVRPHQIVETPWIAGAVAVDTHFANRGWRIAMGIKIGWLLKLRVSLLSAHYLGRMKSVRTLIAVAILSFTTNAVAAPHCVATDDPTAADTALCLLRIGHLTIVHRPCNVFIGHTGKEYDMRAGRFFAQVTVTPNYPEPYLVEGWYNRGNRRVGASPKAWKLNVKLLDSSHSVAHWAKAICSPKQFVATRRRLCFSVWRKSQTISRGALVLEDLTAPLKEHSARLKSGTVASRPMRRKRALS